MSFQELSALVQPPEKPVEVPKKPNWKQVEKSLGISLPVDYREYIVAYGTGVLCNFVVICNPFSEQDGFALLPFVKTMTNTLVQLKQSEGIRQVPFDVHPARPGLLPFGGDENGNVLYWLTEGDPAVWPCVVGEGRGKRWERYDVAMTTFIAKILTKEIRCKIWPGSFPGRKSRHAFNQFI
jgi:SMI1-KNR4 cell-wall